MIAVDTNLLVYAHREDSEWHQPALAILLELANGNQRWAIPWPCVHEFFAIVTHPRIYRQPSTPAQATATIDAWSASPALEFLHESPTYWRTLTRLIDAGRIRGPMIHDARIAAMCLDNGATQLLSADRDFSRFTGLVVRNPLLG
ncbi:MAG TPA: TA system VapC family ribonuclease toxin [Methylomirabilota bacterium]|nr:TA system VapC family ribonuclease toxin [Methylomirabilota bacterium]